MAAAGLESKSFGEGSGGGSGFGLDIHIGFVHAKSDTVRGIICAGNFEVLEKGLLSTN